MTSANPTLRAGMANQRKLAPEIPPRFALWHCPYRLVGFALVTVIPALFWPFFIAGILYLFGASISTATMTMIGLGVFAFLSVICSSILVAREHQESEEQVQRKVLHLHQSRHDSRQGR